MADPTRPGRAALARKLADAGAPQVPEAPALQGTVASTSTGPARVRVTVTGVGTLRCPYLASYAPVAGDVVWLMRVASGSYLCLGKQAP